MKRLVWFALLASSALAQQGGLDSRDVLEVVQVRSNIYMLASASGNVTVQLGDNPGRDGVLLVDTGSASMTPRLMAELRKLSIKPIRYVLNTSADPHHTGGNQAFAAPNEDGQVAVFAQNDALLRMSSGGGEVPAEGWPSITFDDTKDFPFNGESIKMFAEKHAHTDGDSIVYFPRSNVVSTGDVFLTTGYPVIDIQKGGSIQGELKALNHILDITVPEVMQEGGTMVIPGKGRLCDEADVTEYRDMLTIFRDRVADLLKKGQTLEQVKQARLTRDFDGRYSTPAWSGDMLVEAIYKSLVKDPASSETRK